MIARMNGCASQYCDLFTSFSFWPSFNGGPSRSAIDTLNTTAEVEEEARH